jgi:hypothetical protein
MPSRAGELVAAWCATTGTSQTELGRRCGFGEAYINHLARGLIKDAPRDRLRRIAEVTGLGLETLLGDRSLPPERRVRTGDRLADALRAVEASARFSRGRKTEIRRHLEAAARWLERPLDRLPADPRWLRQAMRDWNGQHFGCSEGYVGKVRSAVKVALEALGACPAWSRRPIREVGPAWLALYEAADAHERAREAAAVAAGWRKPRAKGRGFVSTHLTRLSAFVRYCDAMGIAPDEVDDATAQAFMALREASDLARGKSTRRRLQELRHAWNHFALLLEGWPKVVLTVGAEPRRTLRLPREAFPASFLADLGAYERAAGVRDAERYDPEAVGVAAALAARLELRLARGAEQEGKKKGRQIGEIVLEQRLRPDSVAKHLDVARLAASPLVRHPDPARRRPIETITGIDAVATLEGALVVMEACKARLRLERPDGSRTSTQATLVGALRSMAVRWRPDLGEEEAMALELLAGMANEGVGHRLGDEEAKAVQA